jgi:hypothetical protein
VDALAEAARMHLDHMRGALAVREKRAPHRPTVEP